MTASPGSGATRATTSCRSQGSPQAMTRWCYAAIPRRKRFPPSATSKASSSASSRSTAPATTCSDDAFSAWIVRCRRKRRRTRISISKLRSPDRDGFRAGRKFRSHLLDLGERRQARFVAEPLDLVGGGGAREMEMFVPAFLGMGEVRIDIGAVEDIAGTVGVDHALARNRQRRQCVNRAGLVVPEQTLFTERDPADAAAAALEIVQHLLRRQLHLF